MAKICGGDELGTAWQMAGILEHRQTVFDDFRHTATALEGEGYSSPYVTVAMGESIGGLLVAACLNQAPEQFRCIIACAPILDVLRLTSY